MDLTPALEPVNTPVSSSSNRSKRPRRKKLNNSGNLECNIPRPSNPFILFRDDFLRQGWMLKLEGINHCSQSALIGKIWSRLGEDKRAYWKKKSAQEKLEYWANNPQVRYTKKSLIKPKAARSKQSNNHGSFAFRHAFHDGVEEDKCLWQMAESYTPGLTYHHSIVDEQPVYEDPLVSESPTERPSQSLPPFQASSQQEEYREGLLHLPYFVLDPLLHDVNSDPHQQVSFENIICQAEDQDEYSQYPIPVANIPGQWDHAGFAFNLDGHNSAANDMWSTNALSNYVSVHLLMAYAQGILMSWKQYSDNFFGSYNNHQLDGTFNIPSALYTEPDVSMSIETCMSVFGNQESGFGYATGFDDSVPSSTLAENVIRDLTSDIQISTFQ
uniref:HMG box domain-containing protein n=1 Tax=Psilocybe cubensis TaxID=181762 RepID=A0A8H7XMQ2_PSICU